MRKGEDKIILTAVGDNRVGVLGELTGKIGELKGNIQDISQKMMGGKFNLLMEIELAGGSKGFANFKAELEKLGEKNHYKVSVVNEKIFRYMHRI